MNEFDDPFGLHRQSTPTNRVDSEGRKIHVLGAPILAWNQTFNSGSVPAEYRTNPFVDGRFFYSLPQRLIEAVVQELGEERFDRELLDMERRLTEVAGDHSPTVGFWQGRLLPYFEFHRVPLVAFSDKDVEEVGLEPGEVADSIRLLEGRNQPLLAKFSKAYCGWLMTNREFLDEHDQLLSRHVETVRRHGSLLATTLLPDDYRATFPQDLYPNDDPLWSKFLAECKPFLLRWRLAGLAGPYLPIPAKPLLAGTFPLTVVQELIAAGGVFFLPDTMPIPSRDQLRDMLDHALHRGDKPVHLEEWLDMVRPDNTARNRMDPFIRYFELEHYWRILRQRHSTAIYRKSGKLESAFATYLRIVDRRIHEDMIAIRKRLGSDWLERPWPLHELE